MRDVSSWLERLGLGKYAPLFAEHEIDPEALPHLTEAMLERMGLPLGPRAKIMAAIAPLHPVRPRAERTSNGATSSAVRRERRQLTVMFCDLVDSTKLATRLDPEDYSNVIQSYQRTCAQAVARYDGHVSQYRGDGIEVLFGWPFAQEDAAERAVRAGLDIVEAVKAMREPEPLAVRVGITTGIVAVGLDEPSSPSGAVGEALHVVARLQGLAAPNTVLVAEPTSRLVSARFDQQDLGPHDLKGLAEPVRVFRVLRVRPDASRFQAATERPLTPLVGRATELAFLEQRWREAKDGDGQAVFLSGVAGVGKSRIAFELERHVRDEPHFAVALQCLPHCMQSALFPVIRLLVRLTKSASQDSDDVKLREIEKLARFANRDVEKTTPLLADILSAPTGARYPPLALPAQQLKTQTLLALADLLLGASERRPVYCLLEDAQWIDPSTQELLDLVLSQIATRRILLVVTHRPDYPAPSQARRNIRGMTIGRLGRHDAAEMARLVLPEPSVSAAVIRKVVDGSDAVPLFIEELARGAFDSSELEELGFDNRPAFRPPGWVPDTLRDSLIARLDRAPQARSVAQTAAVIGREFSYDVLLRVSSLTAPELESSLEHLTQSDIIKVIDTRPALRYAFKHALLRDAAYETLLRSSRRYVHAKVAAVLETHRPDVVAAQPELLAYHYSLAGNAEFAARYWLAGAQRARSRWANLEAIVQFQKALEFLELLPETRERMLTELEIQLSLGFSCIAAHGYSSNHSRKPFERACQLSEEVGDSQKQIHAIYGLWGHFWMRARHDRALEISQTILGMAKQVQDPIVPVLAHRTLGSTLFTVGEFTRAREHLERAVELGGAENVETLPPSFAVAPSVAARLLLAWDLWILGYPDQAYETVRDVHAATAQADPYTAAFAHYVMSAVHLLRGEHEDSLRHAERSFALSNENRINLYALYSRFGRGCALVRLGKKERGLVDIQQGIDEARSSQLGYMRGFMLGWLATALAESGDVESGLSTVDAAIGEIDDVIGRAWEAELKRLRGDMLLAMDASAGRDAERSYREAIAVAQAQHARSLELRSASSLARLLRSQGRFEIGMQGLKTVFSSFTEGFATADLKEASELLAQP